jgi:uncharacterized protein (DUF305 family)
MYLVCFLGEMARGKIMKNMYVKLALMAVVSFIAMYLLMYMMIDKWADFYPSVSMAYMAGSMTAAMLIIELIVMSGMYESARLRNIVIGASAVLLVAFVLFTRYQTGIYDNDFLRSMIPHHSGAILMCANPKLTDPEIKSLCRGIIDGQQREIEQMKAIMRK